MRKKSDVQVDGVDQQKSEFPQIPFWRFIFKAESLTRIPGAGDVGGDQFE